MDIKITPTMCKYEDIKSISMANEIVDKFNRRIPVKPEDLKLVLCKLYSNPYKFFEVVKAAFALSKDQYCVDYLGVIMDELENLDTNSMTLRDVDMAIKVAAKLSSYIENSKHIDSKIKTELVYKLGRIQISFIEKKTDLIPNSAMNAESDDYNIKLASLIGAMLEMITECQQRVIATEGVKDKLRKGTEKVINKVVNFSIAEKQMSDKLNEKFNRFVSNYREDRKTASYDKLVKSTIDLSRLLKNVLTSSIIALIIPGGIPIKLVAGAITLLAQFAKNEHTDSKYRGVVLNDLKFELRVVQEKIKDAESKGDNRAKYKLMRVENQIARAIDRINYRLPAEKH